ncbi:hypothetical protein [Roseovarius nanhaiticus]|uniref:hypothetical protein n=1 Tax=Roseovarius nanhaiticus TaxID=573024 RepID=UPI0011143A54|nr:hypothetical protein [Roseovarius nanhaiticus]
MRVVLAPYFVDLDSPIVIDIDGLPLAERNAQSALDRAIKADLSILRGFLSQLRHEDQDDGRGAILDQFISCRHRPAKTTRRDQRRTGDPRDVQGLAVA